MNHFLLFDYKTFHTLIKMTFGSKAEIRNIQIKKSLQDYQVLFVQLNHSPDQIVVKLASPRSERHSQFDRTAMINRRIRQETHLPVPEIFAWDISSDPYPFRYLIQSYLPGTEWADLKNSLDADEKGRAFQQIAEAVAQVHSITYPYFGEIDPSGSMHGSLRFLQELKERSYRHVTNTRLHDVLSALFEKYSGELEGVTGPCLCHEDFHQHNILFSQKQGQWHLAAILDFDKCWAGKNEIDLARLEIWHETEHPQFWEAYLSCHDLDPGYDHRRAIYQLIWCLEFNQATVKALDVTRQLCLALALPFSADAFRPQRLGKAENED